MPEIRIISDPQDASPRPATRTIKDALSKLVALSELPAEPQLELRVRAASGESTYFSALYFRSSKGDDALFALPISQGCWATGTLGDQLYMNLDRLGGAEVDCDGNFKLRDGTYVHAVALDVMSLHFELPELEEIIVDLTIRYLKAEAQCFRIEYGICFGIDYGALPDLRVPNVKALTRYVNEKIETVPRRNGVPPFKRVSVATVHRTLDLVFIQKLRGRPKKTNSR